MVGAPDHGYFYYDSTFPAWGAALRWVIQQGDGVSGLNQACVTAVLKAGGNPADCAFPETVTPYIASPLFVVNSMYDPALDSISGNENGKNFTNVQRLGDKLKALVTSTVLNRPGNAAFLTACHQVRVSNNDDLLVSQ